MVKKNYRWIVNNGDQALFWEDIWYQGQPLMVSFRKLFQLSKLKNEVVRNVIVLWECYDHEGEVFWSRQLRHWELEEVIPLNKVITSINLSAAEDTLIWTPYGKEFSTKDGLVLWNKSDVNEDWCWNFIWKMQLPPNVKLFLWKVHSPILPTKSFLRGRIGMSA